MASFASQPVQFTPYIPPTNLEADNQRMNQRVQADLQVGMYKQQQYQLGVQKIQGLVDNIMGLQVSKDVDKEYLSNLQSETISNVRKIAGQDLSKQSLINQAGTYASAIFNDQNVRNAVASTQNMQDALAQIQKAHEEGKSGTSNDWAIMKKIQAWQNDGKVGSTLGKQQYTNYYDHTAELQKFLKDKNPNTIIKQEPFETNADGTPKWGAYALVEGKEVKLSSVDLQRDIQTFYMSNIQAKGQLDLDSGYYADHLDDTTAFQQFRQENESSLAALQREIKAYQDDSKMNPSNAAINQTKILQLEEAFTKRQLMNRDSEAAFLRDPYSAKTALFQSNLIKGMADRYAYTDLQQKFVKNPIFDGMMEESRFNLQQVDSNRAERRFQWEQEKWALDFDQEERKMANNIKAAQIASGVIIGGDYNAAAAEARTPEDRINELKVMGQSVAQQQMAMLYSMNPDNGIITIGTDSGGNTIYRLAQGKTQVDVNNLFQQAQRSYDENPSGASREVRDFFGDPNNESYGIGKLRSWSAQTKQVDEIEANIERKLANSKGYRDYTDKLKSLGNSDEVLYRQGNTSLTRSDLVKFYENQTRTNFFWSPEDISRETGLSMDKVNALGLIINNEAETVVGDVLNAGRTLVSGFQYSPGGKEGEKLRKEFSRIKSLGGEEFAKIRKAEYQKYDKNYSGTTVAIPIDTKNRGIQESVIAFARLQPGNESFGSTVTGAKGAGDITVIAHKNTAGEVTATLKNSKGDVESVTLDAITAQQLVPQVMTTDPFQAQNTLLQANKGLYRNVPSVTGTSPTTAYPVRQLNEKYDFRFHIKQNESGNGFSPIGYYKEKTSKTWLPVPYEPPYMGQDEANTYYDNLIKQGTQYLETNLLK